MKKVRYVARDFVKLRSSVAERAGTSCTRSMVVVMEARCFMRAASRASLSGIMGWVDMAGRW
jgi:hypothetical protein